MSKDNLQNFLTNDAETIIWKVCAREGMMIQSIRELRARHEHCHGYLPSLKDAKDIVECYRDSEQRKPRTKHTSTLTDGEIRIFQTANGSFTVEIVKVTHGLSMEDAFTFLSKTIRDDSK